MDEVLESAQSRIMCPQLPPRPAIQRREIGPVYFMRCGPYIKIGYSVDPHTRLNQLRNGDKTKCPDGIDRKSIVLVKTEPGGRDREYELHQQFKHLHHWGEWFTEAPELTEYIEALSERKPAEWPTNKPRSPRTTSSGRAGSRFTSPPGQLFTKHLPRLR